MGRETSSSNSLAQSPARHVAHPALHCVHAPLAFPRQQAAQPAADLHELELLRSANKLGEAPHRLPGAGKHDAVELASWRLLVVPQEVLLELHKFGVPRQRTRLLAAARNAPQRLLGQQEAGEAGWLADSNSAAERAQSVSKLRRALPCSSAPASPEGTHQHIRLLNFLRQLLQQARGQGHVVAAAARRGAGSRASPRQLQGNAAVSQRTEG